MNNKWKLKYYIRQGIKHANNSKPCQDYILTTDDNKGIALADGVSSCKNSEFASKISCSESLFVCENACKNKELLHHLITTKSEEICKGIAKEITNRIRQKLDKQYPDADSTLVFVYMINERFALVGYIGDSALILLSDKESKVLTQTRTYPGGATESVGHHNSANLMNINVIDVEEDAINAFILTSDGLENKLYIKGGEDLHVMKDCEYCVNAVLEKNSDNIIKQYLDDVQSEDYFDDDISLVVFAWKKTPLPDDPKWSCDCGYKNPLYALYCEKCNKDFIEIYSNSDIYKYPSTYDYFKYLNTQTSDNNITLDSDVEYRINHSSNKNLNKTIDYDNIIEDAENLRYNQTKKLHSARKKRKQSKNIRNKQKFAYKLGCTIAITLCSILIINFFMMIYLSVQLSNLEKEIYNLKDTYHTATKPVATPSEANRIDTTLATTNSEKH